MHNSLDSGNHEQVLDWSANGGTSVGLFFGALFAAAVLHFFFFGIYKLRVFIYSKLRAEVQPSHEKVRSASPPPRLPASPPPRLPASLSLSLSQIFCNPKSLLKAMFTHILIV